MILQVNMYITCQIGLKLKIGQNRTDFYEFDRFRVLTRKS
jgi:hypothetical protein